MDISYAIPTDRFACCIAASKRVRWDIESDVIRGRRFDHASKFLPDGLSLASRLDFLSPPEKLYFSQVQGRTYANMFGLVERFIGAHFLCQLSAVRIYLGGKNQRAAASACYGDGH